MKLRGLVPNFYIHVSVSDLYIPMIGPRMHYSKIGGSIVRIYKSLKDMNVDNRNEAHSFISGNICFEFLVQCDIHRTGMTSHRIPDVF